MQDPSPPPQQCAVLCSDTSMKFKKTAALTKKQQQNILTDNQNCTPFLSLFIYFFFAY